MTIDFHTHIFPDAMAEKVIVPMGRSSRVKHYADGTAAGLLASMDRAGVDWSVVLPVATNAGQVERLNATSAEANEIFAGRGLFSFGAMHPDYADYKAELARVKDRGLKGVKIHPPYQQVPLDDPRCLRILERCAELDLIVVTHAGVDVGVPGAWCTPEQTVRAVEQVPWPKLVLAHLGGWRQWDQVLEKLAGRDLYLDTAFCFGRLEPAPGTQRTEQERRLIRRDQFSALVTKHGADKILFATDSPWSDPARDLAELESMPLTAGEKAAIRGENARALLGLREERA